MAPPDNPTTTNVKSKLKLHYLKENNKLGLRCAKLKFRVVDEVYIDV